MELETTRNQANTRAEQAEARIMELETALNQANTRAEQAELLDYGTGNRA